MQLRKTCIMIGAIAGTFGLATSSQAATITVNQVGTTFDPPNVTVQPGDTIEWIWASSSHTVTSGTPCMSDGRFDTPLNAGNPLVAFNVPNNEPDGTIPYFCIPHCGIGMTGTITVQGVDVPAASEWGMVTMALILLTTATVVLTRRSRAAA